MCNHACIDSNFLPVFRLVITFIPGTILFTCAHPHPLPVVPYVYIAPQYACLENLILHRIAFSVDSVATRLHCSTPPQSVHLPHSCVLCVQYARTFFSSVCVCVCLYVAHCPLCQWTLCVLTNRVWVVMESSALDKLQSLRVALMLPQGTYTHTHTHTHMHFSHTYITVHAVISITIIAEYTCI